jgi:hypothetical protein
VLARDTFLNITGEVSLGTAYSSLPRVVSVPENLNKFRIEFRKKDRTK